MLKRQLQRIGLNRNSSKKIFRNFKSVIAYYNFNKMIQNPQERKRQIRKPISSNFSARRLAINFEPPTIILEYLVMQTGKLYHHKMRLDSILQKPNSNRIDLLNYLKNKHYLYFNGKLKDEQLLKFIDILLTKSKKRQKNEKIGGNMTEMSPKIFQFNQQGDFNYLSDDEYQQDYEDFEENLENNEVTLQQKPIDTSSIRTNAFNKNTFLNFCRNYEEEKDDLGSVQWNLPSQEDADFI